MPSSSEAVVAAGDGVTLTVRLTPRAARDEIAGTTVLADGRAVIAARVRAVPEKGAANKALEKLLARHFKVASGRVKVVAGLKDRLKTVHVEGEVASLMATARGLGEGGRG